MTSLLTPALLVGGGGLAAYLFLRPKTAAAALPTSAVGMPGMLSLGSALPAPLTIPGMAPSVQKAPNLPASAPAPGRIMAGPAPSAVGETARPVAAAAAQLTGRWGWPVPRWEGRAPVISDGYGSPRPGMLHAGVDVMFSRISTDPFVPGSPNGTKAFVVPDAWPAVAASDGVLWSAGQTSRGFAVVIDHGHVATFYQHLSSLMVPETRPPAPNTPRDKLISIKVGQPLGVIGYDPLDGQRLKHLHFELWNGGPSKAIDPAPLMRAWQVFEPKDVVPLFTSPRNAPLSRDPDFVHVAGYDRRFAGSSLGPPPPAPRKRRQT